MFTINKYKIIYNINRYEQTKHLRLENSKLCPNVPLMLLNTEPKM
jgi:hypothetical protein